MTIKSKSSQSIPLGYQTKSVLRQELMVLMMNFGMMVSGLSLALPAITLNQLTNPTESFYLNLSQSSWFASASSVGTPIGCFVGVFLVDRIGRKKCVILGNMFAIIAWSLMSCPFNVNSDWLFLQLIVSRLLSGFAGGVGGTPASVYGAEICLPELRARLIMVTSMATASGVLITYIVGYFIRNDWRLIGIVFLVYQITCLLLVIPVKESPTWLLSKGQIEEAKASLSYFRGLDKGETHGEVESEFKSFKEVLPATNGDEKISYIKSLRRPEVYKPTILSIIFYILQQFSGTYVVLVYAVQIVSKAGVEMDPYLGAIYVGITRFIVCTVVITWVLERWGRRPVSMFSAGATSACLFVLAGSCWFSWQPILSALAIISYVLASAGIWIIPFLIQPEIFPQNVRGSSCGALSCVAYFISFCSIKVFPWMMDTLGNGNGFAFYGSVALLTIPFVYKFIPETKGKTFIEIEDHFKSKKNEDVENK